MLPKFDSPTFEIKLISLDKPIRYRPFTVKEEKILLIAEEGNEERDILYAIRQIAENCTIDRININSLPIFDLQYLFLQIRAKSVNNHSTVQYRDKEDDEVRKFDLDFDKLMPIIDPNHKTEISLDQDFIVCFSYPTIEMVVNQSNVDIDANIKLIAECMNKIIKGDNVYIADNIEDKLDFIESLPTDKFMLIVEQFLETMPKMIHKIQYTNSLGNERQIVLEHYTDFFQ